ncbi:hypothetical protein ANN_09311 [Periplaneta americana]|uniref:Uncharacterized protein n=1 Tax=Periplaneta americana TaxID=6978 RepID=A0ABQ8TMR8_PERAM|nr:hypothetical protein ANN_09311 [Periplaneta americana]
MSPGSSTESYPAFARIGLRETPEKPQRRCDEQETLPHVLGFCHHGELLRTNRHNMVRSLIASSIRQNASYEVYEEVGCVSSDGSTRRADIIIIDRQKDKSVILDPTIRFEMHEQLPQEKRAKTAQLLDFTEERTEAGGGNRDATYANGRQYLCENIIQILKALSSLENAKIYLERPVLTQYCLRALGSVS